MGNFAWVDLNILKSIDWKTYDAKDNHNVGYFLRVSLRYPRHLMDSTRSLPLAPEKFAVQYSELPQYQKDRLNKLEDKIPKTFISQPRLIAHVYDRMNYAIHYKALQFYLNQGMELIDITEGFSFREEPVFRKMIEFTIEKRRLARSNSMNAVLKLVSNSLYVI